MVVAVAFAGVSPYRVAMRGVVFLPKEKARFLARRLNALRDKPLDRWAVEKWGTGRDWIEKHFDLVDAPPSGVQLAPLSFKRYLAFARVRDIGVDGGSVSVGFDVFVGPGRLSLPVHDWDEARPSARSIHGFAHVAHDSRFEYEISESKRHPAPGHAAFCLVEKPDDLLGDGWTVRRDGVFEVVPEDEVRAMLLVEAPAHRRKGRMRLNADAVVRHEVRNPLERGLVLCARLVVELPEVGD
ncbi:hypothetical protein [Nitrobacter hamburgensis]|uniref:hypothetical protein n=1 Tax=Nitrobacter hamburgensis TaxID=912 RepID=UPI0012EE767F|nr:hypothetical protein [Nitrobacter hamburgensis]